MALLLYRNKQSSRLFNSLWNRIARCHSQTPFISSFNQTTTTSNSCLWKHQPSVTRITDFCYRSFASVQSKESSGYRLNEQITDRFIRLVTDEGHDVVPTFEALAQAKKLKLDLVEVQRSANPTVCKIMDFHKEKYIFDMKMKEKAKAKSEVTMRKGGDSKEVRFSDKTEEKDLKVKADQIVRLMERGYRVKCMVTTSKKKKALPKKFSDEDEHDETQDDEQKKELAALLSRLTTMIEDVSYVESGPKVDGKQAFVVVRHAKFGPGKKKGVKKLKDAVKSAAVTLNAPLSADEGEAAEKNEWSVADSTEKLEEVFDFSNYLEDSVASKEKLNAVQTPTGFDISNFSIPRPVEDSTASFQTEPSLGDENRYRRNEPRNRFQPTLLNNKGSNISDLYRFDPRSSSQRRQSPPGQNLTSFPGERKQTGFDSFTGRNIQGRSSGSFRRESYPTSPNTQATDSYGQTRADSLAARNTQAPSSGSFKGEPNTQAPNRYGIFSFTNQSDAARDPNSRGIGVNSNTSTDGAQ